MLFFCFFVFNLQINPPSLLSPGSAPVNFLILEKVFLPKCLQYFNVRFDLSMCRNCNFSLACR